MRSASSWITSDATAPKWSGASLQPAVLFRAVTRLSISTIVANTGDTVVLAAPRVSAFVGANNAEGCAARALAASPGVLRMRRGDLSPRQGRICEEGRVAEVFADPKNQRTRDLLVAAPTLAIDWPHAEAIARVSLGER